MEGVQFRNFESVSTKSGKLWNHYTQLRSKQTVEHSNNMLLKHCTTFDREMNIWDAFDRINNIFIDASDPDIQTLSNDYHAFQTAEGIRKNGEPEWLQVVGLIHDLGKVIFINGNDEDGTSVRNQWSITGDTFIVGCRIPDGEFIVYPELNSRNPDMDNPKYNTKYGIYQSNCGFDNCLSSFGHDEYFYRVLMHNKEHNPDFNCKLPAEAFYIIRWHSLYPWHQHEAYTHLANDFDLNLLPLLRKFNQYDLYTKNEDFFDINALKPYYDKLIKKYFGTTTLFW